MSCGEYWILRIYNVRICAWQGTRVYVTVCDSVYGSICIYMAGWINGVSYCFTGWFTTFPDVKFGLNDTNFVCIVVDRFYNNDRSIRWGAVYFHIVPPYSAKIASGYSIASLQLDLDEKNRWWWWRIFVIRLYWNMVYIRGFQIGVIIYSCHTIKKRMVKPTLEVGYLLDLHPMLLQ